MIRIKTDQNYGFIHQVILKLVLPLKSSIFHGLSQVLDDRVETLAVTLPLFETLFSIRLELLVFILQVGLGLLCLIKLLPDLGLTFILSLFHLSFEVVLVLFQQLLSELFILLLFRVDFRQFWFPSLLELLVVLNLLLFHVVFLPNLVLKWLLILFLEHLSLLLLLLLGLVLFILEFHNLFIESLLIVTLHRGQLLGLDLVKLFSLLDLLLNKLLLTLFCQVVYSV